MGLKATPKSISRMAGNHTYNPENEIDKLLALFAQISIALLMIFIIAVVLFRANVQTELERAKKLANYYRKRSIAVENTDKGRAFAEKEKALIKLQKQKLIKALDEVERKDRRKLALKRLSKADDSNYSVENIFSEGKVVQNPLIREPFINGCEFAKNNLPYKSEIRSDWLTRTLLIANMRLKKQEELTSISENFPIVTEENEKWLMMEVRRRVDQLANDYIDMQHKLFAYLYRYYRGNPNQLDTTPAGKRCLDLIEKFSFEDMSSSESDFAFSQLDNGIKQHVVISLEKQGVSLLNVVKQ